MNPAAVPPGVIHSNGRAFGVDLTSYYPEWELTGDQFKTTADGYRWYPQRT